MFRVVVHPEALAELARIPAFHAKAILAAMRTVLVHEPTTSRRSRVKKMKGGFRPPYRLRIGDFRVYYDVDEQKSEVLVLHIWEKGRVQTPETGEPPTGRKGKR